MCSLRFQGRSASQAAVRAYGRLSLAACSGSQTLAAEAFVSEHNELQSHDVAVITNRAPFVVLNNLSGLLNLPTPVESSRLREAMHRKGKPN